MTFPDPRTPGESHSTEPPDLDVLEILDAMGEMSMREVYLQVRTVATAWNVIAGLCARKAASLWIEEGGVWRRLEEWEVAALMRARLRGSGEPAPEDSRLMLRAGAG